MFVLWLIVISFPRNLNLSGAWLFQNVKWKLEEKPFIMKFGGCKKNTHTHTKQGSKTKEEGPYCYHMGPPFVFFFSSTHVFASINTTKLLLALPTKLGTWLVVSIGNNSKREGGTSHLSSWSLFCSGELLFSLSLSSC